MEALIFCCFALFLHYDRKLVLFIFCLFALFLTINTVLILFPTNMFQNIVVVSLFQLLFIYCVSLIDCTAETLLILFIFAVLTVVIGIGYFYLPFLNGITWLLQYESRLCLELIVWINFTIFKSTCTDQAKHNILFISWVIAGYGEGLWQYLS